MKNMFSYATSFNQDLSLWNVNNVEDCYEFNYDAIQWTLPQPNFTNCNPNQMKKNDFQEKGSDPSQDLLDSLDSTEIKINKKGCLINFLSVLFGFIGLSIGVGFQVLLFDEGGTEAIGAGIVIAFTFSSYYFSKEFLKKYFNKPNL